jgi:hypothetical protein
MLGLMLAGLLPHDRTSDNADRRALREKPENAADPTLAEASSLAVSDMLRLLYWLYAFLLRRQISSHPVPRHVGIILDGNRRYAAKHRLTHPRAAYDLGAKKLDDVLAWCFDLGIPAVTLWV